MNDLKDKNIIVTGASGGIGNSIVKKLVEAGVNVLASGTRVEKLEELKNKFKNIKILKFDISQKEKIEEFIESATKELGGSLDGIVNNAGITQDNLAIRMSSDEWQKVIDINLTSTFLMSKFAVKKMLKNRSGKIINITTEYVDNPKTELSHYITSKAAIEGFTKSLAIEFASKGIRFNLVSPGMTNTDLIADVPEKTKMVTAAKTPLRKLADPIDIANTISFLSSHDSDHITGETIRINGGKVMK